MKAILLVCLTGLTLGLPEGDYHTRVGFKLTALIKAAEDAGDSEELKTRLWGGWYPQLGQYAYMAGLIIYMPNSDYVSSCGAALISNIRLLTAAHCWVHEDGMGTNIEVVLGSRTLMTGGTRVETQNVIVHEDFEYDLKHNDIALIVVPNIEYTTNIASVKLPHDKYLHLDYIDYYAVITGYGTTSDNDTEFATDLTAVSLKVVSNDLCVAAYGQLYVTDASLCASQDEGKGVCDGDSGGPLAVPIDFAENILIGVLSYSSPHGCNTGEPAVFTRVTSFLAWISDNS